MNRSLIINTLLSYYPAKKSLSILCQSRHSELCLDSDIPEVIVFKRVYLNDIDDYLRLFKFRAMYYGRFAESL